MDGVAWSSFEELREQMGQNALCIWVCICREKGKLSPDLSRIAGLVQCLLGPSSSCPGPSWFPLLSVLRPLHLPWTPIVRRPCGLRLAALCCAFNVAVIRRPVMAAWSQKTYSAINQSIHQSLEFNQTTVHPTTFGPFNLDWLLWRDTLRKLASPPSQLGPRCAIPVSVFLSLS